MSEQITLTTHTTETRDDPSLSNIGLCKFNTTTKAIEVSDGSDWLIYDYDSSAIPYMSNTLSAKFDGGDDQINCGSSLGLDFGSNPFTINAWVRQLDTGINVFLERQNGSGGFQLSVNDGVFKWYGYNSDGFLNFGSGLGTAGWYMLTITHTGGASNSATIKGYVNGVLKATHTGKNYTPASSGSWIMGRAAGYSQYSLNGYLDEVGVWTRVLSDGGVSNNQEAQGDIGDLYNSGTPGNISSSSNLLAWWRMGDSGTNLDGGPPSDNDLIGTVTNVANPGTHDGTGQNGVQYAGEAGELP